MNEINLGFWEGMREGIRKHLVNDDIKTFQQWHEVQSTMVASHVHNAEYEYLISCSNWDLWKEKLKEDKLKPNSHVIFSESSTNNLHHAYSLEKLMEKTGYKLFEFGDVVEFGGGYGNVCRLFREWEHDKKYYSYDIPELIQLQKYYLNEYGVSDNIFFKTEHDIIDTVEGNSLFLGMWSLSEVPIDERAQLLENLKFYDSKNIFLAMGGVFQQENNLKWLNDVVIPRLEKLNYSHKLISIEHGIDMFYFVATK